MLFCYFLNLIVYVDSLAKPNFDKEDTEIYLCNPCIVGTSRNNKEGSGKANKKKVK